MKSNPTCFKVQSRWLAALAGAACLAMSAAAPADEARPCAEFVQKFCKGVEPGGGRIAKCMKEHESELSPACRAKIAEVKDERREIVDACRQDVQKECKGVQPGGGRILECLKDHEATLSPQCKEKLAEAKRMKQHE